MSRMTKSQFFKIIFDHHILEGKLPIPKKFARRYEQELPNHVMLKVKDAVWEVELRNQDGDLWLQNGWKLFAQHFSLICGHFVLFKYKGNGLFHVVIFDKSATEIDYPHTYIDVSSMEDSGEGTEHDILDNVSRSRKRSGQQPLPSSRPLKRMKTSRAGDAVVCGGRNDKQKIVTLPSSRHLKRLRTSKTGDPVGCGGRNDKQTIVIKSMQAYDKARSLQNHEIPSFLVVMRPSYINPGHKIIVPSSFAAIHMTKRESDVILRTSNGKMWTAKYLSNRNTRITSIYTTITSGWRAFLKDNMLEVGDVCLFELIEGSHLSFSVVICRNVQDASRYPSSGNEVEAKEVKLKKSLLCKAESNPTSTRKTKHRCSKNLISKKLIRVNGIQKSPYLRCSQALTTITNFVSEHPFFQVVMQARHLIHGFMCVPYWFVKEHKLQVREQVTLQAAGKSWSVNLISYNGKKASMFSGGWPVFARENSVQAGETYVFELICRSSTLMKVSKCS